MEKELRNTSKADSRQYWRILNKLNGKSEKSEIKASLNDLFEHFKDINQGENNAEEFNIPDDEDETFNIDILNENITEYEIEDSIKNLKNNKAKGYDGVSNEYIKHSANKFMPLYIKLFNLILETGIIPKAWGYGIIHPIYKKKGDPKSPKSYRPITLTSALGKVFTSIIDTRLRIFANSHEIISMAQAGFRKGYSTTDNIFCLYCFIQLYLNTGSKLFCTFIDFRKAFDTVWRIGLWQKLLNTNIKGKIFKVIYNMYADIKSCVRKQSELSDFFPCMTGVRQGENISPFLFTIFLNDIEEFLTHQGLTGLEAVETKLKEELHIYMKIFLLLYADDTVILSNTSENLQLTLKAFENYCEHWKLRINVDKTKVLIFEKRRTRPVRQFFLNENEIEIVDSYCYLGILFNYNGNFLKARNHLVGQAEKALYALYTKLRNIAIPVDLQLKLFDNLVAPILLYSSEVWGFEDKTIIEKIHLKFLKYVMKLRSSTPNYMVYGETGREPMEIKIKIQMLSFWSKLLMNSENKLSGILYQLLYNLHETGREKFKWIECIKTTLNDIGFSYIWTSQTPLSNIQLKTVIKQRMKDQFYQSWFSAIETSSRGSFYSLFKSEFKLEKYLINLKENQRLLICKLRCSNIKFPIEQGRWQNIPRAERKCTLCNSNSIGDEFHYLFTCSNENIKKLRKKYIPNYYTSNPNVGKMIGLLSLCNVRVLVNLSKFIFNIQRFL